MIFQVTLDEVLSGEKTQTRRVVKPHHRDIWHGDGYRLAIRTVSFNGSERTKWQVGKTYAIQPGRGKKSVGRIKITAIRRERLQDISPADVHAEGIPDYPCQVCGGNYTLNDYDCVCAVCDGGVDTGKMLGEYREIWYDLHPYSPHDWHSNPEVWVIEFERVS